MHQVHSHPISPRLELCFITSFAVSSVEPMEQDMEYFAPSSNAMEETEVTKKLLPKGPKETGVYGTMPFRNTEVDASIPFALDHTIVEHRSVHTNGTAPDGNYPHRRAYRRNGGISFSVSCICHTFD